MDQTKNGKTQIVLNSFLCVLNYLINQSSKWELTTCMTTAGKYLTENNFRDTEALE